MKFIERFRSRFAAFVHDLLMIPIAWLAAYWLRFNLDVVPEQHLIPALYMLPVVICVQGAVFWYFGLYRGVWRFACSYRRLRREGGLCAPRRGSASPTYL